MGVGLVARLRLLVASTIPMCVVELYVAICRVRLRTKPILAVYGVSTMVTVAASYGFMAGMGLTGVGVAWLAGQGVVALGVAGVMIRSAVSRRRVLPGS